MQRFGYVVALLIIGTTFGFVAAMASRRNRKTLWLTCGLAATGLLVAGLLDWQAQPVRETPLHTYLLLAAIPALGSTALVAAIPEPRLGFLGRSLLAAMAWLALAAGTLLTAFYP